MSAADEASGERASRSASQRELSNRCEHWPYIGGAMKHVGETALARIEMRTIEGLVEERLGVFYRGSAAFLHFHEDPAGILADGRIGGERQRLARPASDEQATPGQAFERRPIRFETAGFPLGALNFRKGNPAA